jgi:hypothetical protein
MRDTDLRCDGCGQLASPEHIARRLQRLEWSTRYRPVHIGTLLLGAIVPLDEADFIYSPAGNWRGEAKNVFSAVGLTPEGKPAEALLSEFQRGGFFLTHVLECPLENGAAESTEQLLADRFPAMLARIRRSLKPKRLAPISQALEPFLPVLKSSELPCTILIDEVKPFMLDREPPSNAADRLRAAIAASQTSQATGA